MKRTISFIILMLFLMTAFVSCAGENTDNSSIKIVCTQFSAYDWAKNITCNTDVQVILLTDNGIDIHSYQPTARDISDIASADLFIYVGGTSESWVEDVLSTSAKNVNSICMTDVVDTVCIDCAHEEHSHEHHDHEFDEHVWLSIKNARSICAEILQKLCLINQEDMDVYRDNCALYDAELEKLYDDFANAVEQKDKDVLLFTGRFPFIYLLNEFNLKYYAAFDGCSSETAASFETVTKLANIADELELQYGIVVKGDSYDVAYAVADNTQNEKLDFLEMDSLQSVTREDINEGKSYISAMRGNLEAVKIALA